MHLRKWITKREPAKILDFHGKDGGSEPPAYVYTLIMLSVHAGDSDNDKLSQLREKALEQGADLQQIEMAIYRGEQLRILDEL